MVSTKGLGQDSGRIGTADDGWPLASALTDWVRVRLCYGLIIPGTTHKFWVLPEFFDLSTSVLLG